MTFPERYQAIRNPKLIPFISRMNLCNNLNSDELGRLTGVFNGNSVSFSKKPDKVKIMVANKLKVCYKHTCQEVLLDKDLPKKMGLINI